MTANALRDARGRRNIWVKEGARRSANRPALLGRLPRRHNRLAGVANPQFDLRVSVYPFVASEEHCHTAGSVRTARRAVPRFASAIEAPVAIPPGIVGLHRKDARAGSVKFMACPEARQVDRIGIDGMVASSIWCADRTGGCAIGLLNTRRTALRCGLMPLPEFDLDGRDRKSAGRCHAHRV